MKKAVFWDVAPYGFSSEMWILIRPTRRHIPEEGILYLVIVFDSHLSTHAKEFV
jgi:hypothetical protein